MPWSKSSIISSSGHYKYILTGPPTHIHTPSHSHSAPLCLCKLFSSGSPVPVILKHLNPGHSHFHITINGSSVLPVVQAQSLVVILLPFFPSIFSLLADLLILSSEPSESNQCSTPQYPSHHSLTRRTVVSNLVVSRI